MLIVNVLNSDRELIESKLFAEFGDCWEYCSKVISSNIQLWRLTNWWSNDDVNASNVLTLKHNNLFTWVVTFVDM